MDLDVLYLSDRGYTPAIDPGFGVTVAWDIDMLSGYQYSFLSTLQQPMSHATKAARLAKWITHHDVVVVNGYNSRWMLLAMAICRARGIPFLLRGSSHPVGMSTGVRRHLRRAGTRMVVAASSGGLSMGQLNEQFYQQNGARLVIFAPNSVDDERFARLPALRRPELLARWGLSDQRPVVMFCGKLIPRKRPLDLIAAVKLLPQEVTTLFVGGGPMAEQVTASLDPGAGIVTGFVNQQELAGYYHAADILVLPSEFETWGMVVNEAMAAGVLPVVSDRVGAAPDLVRGIGEVYPCGDVHSLAASLTRALARVKDPRTRDRIKAHAARYSLARTAAGFEQGAVAAMERRREHASDSQQPRDH
ncbi:MAG: glycosyltransferase family 4 protein [Streptosporangiaceae bacterium]